MTELRFRDAARVVLVDELERVLLVLFEFVDGRKVWATVGGGLEPGESHEDAARRELAEEAGIDIDDVGPCIWTREHLFTGPIHFDGQRERYFFVRTAAFEPLPRQTWEQLRAEGVTEIRWWTVDEIEAASATSFAPTRLAALLRDLLDHGPPAEPIDVGV